MCLTQEEDVEEMIEAEPLFALWQVRLGETACNVAFGLAVVVLVAFISFALFLEIMPTEVTR